MKNATNIYVSNNIANIKEECLTIKEKVIDFIDYHKNQKQIESNNQLFEEDIKYNEFYYEFDEYSDSQIKNDVSFYDMERATCPNYFIYKIFFVSNTKILFSDKNELIERMNEILTENIDKLLFSYGDKIDFVHNAIKSDKFDPNLDVIQFSNLEEIKLIKSLINKFIGIENSDYRGNCLYFNTSGNIKRGSEIYDPPYGFLALGIKVIGKYNDDNWLTCKNEYSEWAIAYHPIFYF